MRGVNLQEATLWSTIGNGVEIKSLQCGEYDIAFTRDIMQIGCQRHKIDEWFEFDDDAIDFMHKNALTWWRKWGPILKQIVEASQQT